MYKEKGTCDDHNRYFISCRLLLVTYCQGYIQTTQQKKTTNKHCWMSTSYLGASVSVVSAHGPVVFVWGAGEVSSAADSCSGCQARGTLTDTLEWSLNVEPLRMRALTTVTTENTARSRPEPHTVQTSATDTLSLLIHLYNILFSSTTHRGWMLLQGRRRIIFGPCSFSVAPNSPSQPQCLYSQLTSGKPPRRRSFVYYRLIIVMETVKEHVIGRHIFHIMHV